MIMGSVAEDVVRSSSIPTVLCRSETPSSTWENIVVALDGQTGAEEILGDVLLLAPRVGATVHLLQVSLGIVPANCYRGVTFEVPPLEAPEYLNTIAARLKAAGVQAVTDHCSGMAAREIALVAKDLGAGLICMTTRGLPEEPPGLARSVAVDVIRHASCPVYVRRMAGSSCLRR
jgi:nucleotide-binding universal stress UspA family protein